MKTNLNQFQLFNGLSNDELIIIANYMDYSEYEAGDVVFHQGDVCNDIYLIQSGKIEIQLEENKKKIPLAQLETPEYFGELAFIEGKKRSATAFCLEKCRVYRLKPKVLLELKKKKIEIYTVLLENLLKYISQKIHDTDKKLLNLA